VVEAATGSGALITAGTALDQGREVMAVPGNITSPLSEGTNRLILDGAAPLLEPPDVLRHYPEAAAHARTTSSPSALHVLPETLSAEEREVALLLGAEPIHPDALATRAKRSVGQVLALLCALEIAGVVEQSPGRLFRRT
jgi:DNA processing protein